MHLSVSPAERLVSVRHVRPRMYRHTSDTEFQTFSAKYHNDASEDKLFLQPCVLFSRCQDCVSVCIYGQICTLHGKYWDFHFTCLRIFIFLQSFESALVSTCLVFTTGCYGHQAVTPVQREVLHIALCLCVGKPPLMRVSIKPQGGVTPCCAPKCLSHETLSFSRLTN